MNTGKKKNADFLSLLQLIFLRLGASKTPTIRAFSACRPPRRCYLLTLSPSRELARVQAAASHAPPVRATAGEEGWRRRNDN